MSVGAPNIKRPVRRDLVETVTVSRDTSQPGGVVVDIAGRLTAFLGAPAYLSGAKGVSGKVVAEDRYSYPPDRDRRISASTSKRLCQPFRDEPILRKTEGRRRCLADE